MMLWLGLGGASPYHGNGRCWNVVDRSRRAGGGARAIVGHGLDIRSMEGCAKTAGVGDVKHSLLRAG